MSPGNKGTEVLKRKLASKDVYHFVDPDRGYDIKCREVFRNVEKQVHFPFRKTSGRPKYKTIREIVYEGFPGTLGVGILKNPNTGFGFTKELNPLLFALEARFEKLNRVRVSTIARSSVVDDSEVCLNYNDLQRARPKIATLLGSQRDEMSTISRNLLAEFLPEYFKRARAQYRGGQLSGFVESHALKTALLSDEDILSVSQLLSLVPPNHPLVTTRKLLATKESFDRIFIEDLTARFEKLFARVSDNRQLEGAWQEFFKENILYFNSGYVSRFEKERIQGDGSLNIPDFILLNSFGYLDVFEIKTHLTQLLAYDKGRQNFYWNGEAARAIVQAENYFDSLIAEEDAVIKAIRDEYGIFYVDAVRPVVYIIASSREAIAGPNTAKYKGKVKKKLWNDFRRLNHSLKNVTFVLYDELLGAFKNMIKRLEVGGEQTH